MTTIAYRDGIMAADSRAWSNGHTPVGSKVKIRRLPGGTLIGCSSGVPGGAEVVMDWYAAGADREATLPTDFTFLAVGSDGRAYFADNVAYLSGPIEAAYYAIGSGARYALGALYMGAIAVEAIHCGIALDTVSDGPIVILKHEVTGDDEEIHNNA